MINRERGKSLPKETEANEYERVRYEYRPKRTYSIDRSTNSGSLNWDFTITGDGAN